MNLLLQISLVLALLSVAEQDLLNVCAITSVPLILLESGLVQFFILLVLSALDGLRHEW